MVKKAKSIPEVRNRLRAQVRAQNDAVRRRGQTRQAMQRSGRGLPAAGGTGGNTQQARDQRRTTARRVQAGQQATVARAWNRVAAANDRQETIRSQSRMTSGNTRYVPPGGENAKGPSALPPGQRGGAIRPRGGPLATPRSESRGSATPPSSASGPRGPRPGGRVVVDETPRLPPSGRGGALVPSSGGGSVRGSGGPIQRASVRDVTPGPGRLGGGGRPSLPAGGRGGALARSAQGGGSSSGGGGRAVASAAAGKGAGLAGRVAGGALAALAIPGAVNDVVQGFRNVNKPYVALANRRNQRANEGGLAMNRAAEARGRAQVASRTPAQKPQEGPSRTPDQPRVPGARSGGAVAASGGRSVTSSAPARTATSSRGSTSTAPSKSPAEMAATDSWSVNFLRSRRGLPSLAKARGAEEPKTNPGDLGSRAQGEGGYSLTDEDKKRQRKG